jgi:GTP 3',8-cyclase
MNVLKDHYGRQIRKLRVSLTDKCNLRCHYCMPEDASFMPKENYLTAEEYYDIISDLCDLGLEEIRLTGGEPLMRADFQAIVSSFAKLPLKQIGITTNAILLDRHISFLKEYNLKSLNISLDSLHPSRFLQISRRDEFHRTMRNIEEAVSMGFNIKINTVVMKDINHDELIEFVELAKKLSIEVRFLEVMRIGEACEKQNAQYMSALEMQNIISQKYKMTKVSSALDATAVSYVLENGAHIGFIASESQPFCGACSRWRLSADGIMRACLLKDDGLVIKNKTKMERIEIFHKLLGMKPALRPKEVNHFMYQIGG